MTCVIFCGGRIDDYAHAEEYCKSRTGDIRGQRGPPLQGTGHSARHPGGDFDSIDKSDYIGLKAAGVEMIGYPAEKDMTDSELAVEIAINRGCSRVILLGAIGSRLDHSISNLFLLKKNP